MSPSAMTAAGRGAAANARPAPAPGHRRHLRKPVAPARPRRVSGPARSRPRTRNTPNPAVLLPHVVGLVRSLPDRSLVDRLVRGRAWIPVLGVLLAGIVAMQVEVLKLGTSIGRSIERSSALQGQNEALQASVATLSDSQRIERLAANMGMIMPAPTGVSFLSAGRNGNVGAAVANIHAPDPAEFEAQLPGASSSGASDASAQTGSSTGADGSSATVSIPNAPAITATAPSSAAGDASQGTAGGAPPTDGAGAAPTDASGSPTGAAGAAAGTSTPATGPTGPATGANGAAAPVAGPTQTNTGAEG